MHAAQESTSECDSRAQIRAYIGEAEILCGCGHFKEADVCLESAYRFAKVCACVCVVSTHVSCELPPPASVVVCE